MGKAASKKSVVKSAGKSAASRNGKATTPAAKPAAKVSVKPAAKPAKIVAKAVAAAKSFVKAAVTKSSKPVIATAPAKTKPISKPTTATAKSLTKAGGSTISAKAMQPVASAETPKSKLAPTSKVAPSSKPSRIETKPEPYRPMNVVEQASSSGDSKPKKNQAGLSVRELEHFRDLLLEKRRELVGDMSSMEREALQSGDSGLSTLPIHMADMGTDNYEQEFTLGLVEKDRTLLREINHALAKIQNGSYGLCEGNGKPITKVRLEAQPWARFSIEFARLQEKGPIRR